nr:hypothetical protein CFP56_07025 [Quercus suber]
MEVRLPLALHSPASSQSVRPSSDLYASPDLALPFYFSYEPGRPFSPCEIAHIPYGDNSSFSSYSYRFQGFKFRWLHHMEVRLPFALHSPASSQSVRPSSGAATSALVGLVGSNTGLHSPIGC